MLGPVGTLRTRTRVLAAALTVAAALVALTFAVSAPAARAAAGGCDTWTNTAGGNWFTGSNWSKEAPPSAEEEACITTPGTYTVTMTQTAAVSLRSLSIGAASGTQTLVVGSSCSSNANLSTSEGIVNGASGAITLTNGDGCGDSVTLEGPISNAGTIASEVAKGGSRTIKGNLVNSGTFAVNTPTAFNGTSSALTNDGAIDVAEGKQLSLTNGTSLANESSGSIVATGSGEVSMGTGTTFDESGTTSGSKPVVVDDATLDYTGSGKSLIALHGSSSLIGNLGSEQSLSIESTCGENAVTTAAASFTNAGTITLTNGDGCGDNATLTVSSGTLTNTGKLAIELDHGGQRHLQGSIINKGTLAVKATTAYDGASAALTNEGALNLAEGTELVVSKSGSVANRTGGSISATGNSVLSMGPGTSFTEAAGTTSGSKPVVVDDGTLTYGSGGGKSLIALHGSTALSGTLSAVQSLSIESTCSENALATAASGLTNAGTITLTNGDGCGNNAALTISSGTLANSGKLLVEVSKGGTRQIQGNVTNTGTVAIKANALYNAASALFDNEGVVTIGEGLQLSVSNGSSVTNGSGGSVSTIGTGQLLQSGGTFTEGAGTTSGAKPVVVDDSTLSYTGTGKSSIALHGSDKLQGDIGTEQSLSIESTCSEHATTTAATSFASTGTITLTNGDGCGNNATLDLGEGATFTNSGSFLSQPANGGQRTLEGNFSNDGTMTINANTGDPTGKATIDNNGALDIANGTSFTVTGAATVLNGSGGTIFGAASGALVQTTGVFDEAAGATAGTTPVILDNLTLNYSEHGSGPIQLRGSSVLSGTVRAGETLAIASTCSQHADVTAGGSFNANGTLELTNGDGCGNNATLNLKGGTLTNNGVLNIANPHGGTRTIEGNLVNNLILGVSAGQTLHLSGNYTQSSAARFKTFIASASSFGALAATGTATIAGTLVVRQQSFKASPGQSYTVLTGSSLSGTFANEIEDQINFTGLYYKPTYSASSVTLLATQATQLRTPKSGPSETVVSVTGSGYLPGDTITPSFTDHSGNKTTFPTVIVGSGGEIEAEITIPAGASLGNGEIVVTSTQTGVHVGQTFTVTSGA